MRIRNVTCKTVNYINNVMGLKQLKYIEITCIVYIEFSYTVNHVSGLIFDVTNLMCSKDFQFIQI